MRSNMQSTLIRADRPHTSATGLTEMASQPMHQTPSNDMKTLKSNHV